jgi:hypothetical protein
VGIPRNIRDRYHCHDIDASHDMTIDDFIFLTYVFQFGTALLAAIIIAWTPYKQPYGDAKPEPEPDNMPKVVIQMTSFNGSYMVGMHQIDMVTTYQQDKIRKMLTDGSSLTFRSARAYGFQRPEWNTIRARLEQMKFAEYRPNGSLVLNTNGMRYLNLPLPKQNT